MIRIIIPFLIVLLFQGNLAFGAIGAKKLETTGGMTILLVESHSLPMVQINVLIRAGAILDPPEKAGLAYLAANLLEEGTGRRSSKQIADALDSMGTEFSASPGADYSTFSMKLLRKNLEKGMELFSDILIHPKFPEEELSREKNELQSRLIDQKDDPETVASLAFNKALFGKHPYHQPLEGDEETIKNISSNDLKQFYGNNYNPKNAVIALVGDLSEKEAEVFVEKYFGKWPSKPILYPKHSLPSKIMKRDIILVDKELAQTSIIVGNIGINRNNPDYYPIQVMNYILGGGGFSSRMLSNIRDNKGLVYSLHSHFNPYLETGSFQVAFQTKNGSANEALSEVLKEIREIQNAPVKPEELQEAKDYLIGSFPLKMDTYGKLAGFLITQEFYGLGLDYFEKYARWIKNVTPQDVQRVAKEYLDADHFLLVAVGKQSEAGITFPVAPRLETKP